MKAIGGLAIGMIGTCAASVAWVRTGTVEVSQDDATDERMMVLNEMEIEV